MDRTWLETVHFLGLDVQLAVVALFAALEALLRVVETVREAVISRRPTNATRDDGAFAQRFPAPDPAWPPEGWRPNH